MPKTKLFFISFIFTACLVGGLNYFHRPKGMGMRDLVQISKNLFITAQLKPDDVRFLKRRQIGTIVDIRPDGESVDQTPSSEIESAAKAHLMEFHYIPVPHEEIPESAVTALGAVLSQNTNPAVLYCRTGRRAVRLFALVEASRVDGPDADAILQLVQTAGFSADDLKENIARRISQRKSIPESKTDE